MRCDSFSTCVPFAYAKHDVTTYNSNHKLSEPSHLLTCSDESSGQCLGNISGTNKSDSHYLRVFNFLQLLTTAPFVRNWRSGNGATSIRKTMPDLCIVLLSHCLMLETTVCGPHFVNSSTHIGNYVYYVPPAVIFKIIYPVHRLYVYVSNDSYKEQRHRASWISR
jgi:hypothetical protein